MAHELHSAFESETFEQDAAFHLDQPVGSMSISPCGRDVVLASREGLHVIDLDSPYSPPRYLPHRTSWEVADVQWSPFAARDYWVVSTSNQKALVWNLDLPTLDAIDFVLHGHTRAITDINFSAHYPDLLATCAVDSFVHVWDLKDPRRPAISFSDWFAGATQVKWNRRDENIIASSHDKFLRIWDRRKGAYPVRSIQAHATKIYGVDWNSFHINKIVTCSLDKTIKFWNWDNLEDIPERVIDTPFPVWRARHTPFGWGLLAMPQRSNGDLHLYDRRDVDGKLVSGPVKPVAIFPGHKGQVKEFLWRARGTVIDGVDHCDFQLVSWGTDRELRLHRLEPDMLSGIGYVKGESKTQRLIVTRKGARYRTLRDPPSATAALVGSVSESSTPSSPTQSFKQRSRTQTNAGMSKVSLPHFRSWVQNRALTPRVSMHGRTKSRHDMDPISWMKNVKISSWDPDTLAEEITQVGEKFSKIDFEAVDVRTRRITISTRGPWGEDDSSLYIRVDMRFPKAYPREANAMLTLQKTSSMSKELAYTLTKEMRLIAEAFAMRRRGCLEAIVRYLLREQSVEEIVSRGLDESIVDSKLLEALDLTADASSSDDDDDRMDGFQADSGTQIAQNASNLNALVPVPKACGAVWADNGKLVCFFPPKSSQTVPIVQADNISQMGMSYPTKLLEGPDRPHSTFPDPDGFLSAISTNEEYMSGSSDDESSSSASSSSSSKLTAFISPGVLSRQRWRKNVVGLPSSQSAERSNLSVSALAPLRSSTVVQRNLVSIRTLDDLIPFKLSLALGYMAWGFGPVLCEYNALVALNASEHSRAAVWRLIKLILQNRVPLDCLRGLKAGQSIYVVAQRASKNLDKMENTDNLKRSTNLKAQELPPGGRVRWGTNPFGSAWLLREIFHHFEILGDIQMLAMLSCVLAEPKSDLNNAFLQQIEALPYYPSREVAEATLTQNSDTSVGYGSLQTALGLNNLFPSNSQGVVETKNGEGAFNPNKHSLSNATTIRDRRLLSRPLYSNQRISPDDAVSAVHSVATSLSTSPEETRHSQRSKANIAFSVSRASLSAIAQSYSSSSPTSMNGLNTSDSYKKSSPSGSLASGAWSTTNAPGNSGSGRGQHNLSQSSGALIDETRSTHLQRTASISSVGASSIPEYDVSNKSRSSATGNATRPNPNRQTRPKHALRKRNANFRVSLHNQDMFDMDGYVSLPLLDPASKWKYQAYRTSYANALGIWGLYPQMAEILKFDAGNGLEDDGAYSKKEFEMDLRQILSRRSKLEAAKAETIKEIGLQVRQCCIDCGHALTSIEKNGMPMEWQCTESQCLPAKHRKSVRSLCTICNKTISGLTVPCMQCGHVTCYTCAEEWFGNEALRMTNSNASMEDVEATRFEAQVCPGGCGCLCSNVEFVIAPYPTPVTIEDKLADVKNTYSGNRAERFNSDYGPESSVGTALSLLRTRSSSMAQANTPGDRTPDEMAGPAVLNRDEFDLWSRTKIASTGRDLGRNLTSKASDSTIRRHLKK